MKKKGPRSIPDFSPNKKQVPTNTAPGPVKTQVPPPPATRIVKPHATSAKSGRRGS